MLKHRHVNTKRLAFQIHLHCFRSVFNTSKHGEKVSLPWPLEGFRLAVARDQYREGQVRFGFVLVQCSTGRLFPLLCASLVDMENSFRFVIIVYVLI